MSDPSDEHQQLMKIVVEHIFHLSHKGNKDRLSGKAQLMAILYIAKETLGVSRKAGTPAPLYACLTNRQIARAAGCDERAIVDILSDAAQFDPKTKRGRGLIEALTDKKAREKGFPPSTHANAKWYRVCAENWATAKPYVATFTVAKQPDAVEPDAVEPDAVEPDAVEMQAASPVIVLAPGQRCRTVHQDSKGFFIYSTATAAIRVETSRNKAGVLGVHVADAESAPPQGRKKGEPALQRGSTPELRRMPPPAAELSVVEDLLFEGVRNMQASYPGSAFANPMASPDVANDRAFITRLAEAIGADAPTSATVVVGFLHHVNDIFKGRNPVTGSRAPARCPGKAGGPDQLGWLLTIAAEYRALSKR